MKQEIKDTTSARETRNPESFRVESPQEIARPEPQKVQEADQHQRADLNRPAEDRDTDTGEQKSPGLLETLKRIVGELLFSQKENLETEKHCEADTILYMEPEKVMAQCPKEESDRGSWSGERGESRYIPNPEYKTETQDGREVCEKLNYLGGEGIDYQRGLPDFSHVSVQTVSIEAMCGDRSTNFLQADICCAKAWNEQAKDSRTDWKPDDVYDYRKDNRLTWHERADMIHMDLVDSSIHQFFGHVGGVCNCKAKEALEGKQNGNEED